MYLFQPAYIPPFWQLKSELNIFNTNIRKKLKLPLNWKYSGEYFVFFY